MLDSKYRIDQLLAVGGMGAVYVGTHTKLRKRVAIKVLNPQLSSPLMIERFHREAITASQIGHEGIAQVTDLGTSSDGEPFLVMELLEGESLAKRLKATGAMPIETACQLGAAILSPLEAAHRAGIVHRDLKPDNVYLVRQSRGEMVKLLDFGISRAPGLDAEFRLTTTGLVLGTPYYMSPEQARGDHEITHLADIYAFGVILYEMLCGRVPIQGENYNQIMFKVMNGDYRPPRELRPDLPRELENIILAAIAVEPHMRPRSAAALENALLPFCGSAFRGAKLPTSIASPAIAAPTVPNNAKRAVELATTSKRRRRVAIAGIASVSVIAGIVAISATTPHTGTKPVEAKLVETKPIETKPVETKLAETKLAETKPAETKPAETRPAETQLTASQSQPPVAEPVDERRSGAPTPGPPSKPTTITLRFSIVPSSARVYVDGGRITTDHIEVAKDDALHKIRISAPGYVSHDETIKFDETQKLAIELTRGSKSARTQRSAPGNKGSEKIESQSPYD